tara:strand:+ start:43 stop:246 length:204 start_codon:yes stop_codon:yes gene_type:complete
MGKKKKIVYIIINHWTDDPFETLKVYEDGNEALLDLNSSSTSLRIYEVEDKAEITKYNEKYGKKENK